ncbi:MAG: hypothetical protein H0W62_04645 [Chitinophagales bacterium]|nr:hypothetical protein [Chitinophagales bacterium]
MNITEEKIGENHVKLVINLDPEDYMNKVEGEIKILRKKLTLDGFRPGKVPEGIAKKQYGNTVLAEQLNKIIQDSVFGYIDEKKLRIMGQPLPFEIRNQQIDIYHPDKYAFGFEVGLIPDFELPPIDQKEFEKKVIRISDEMIDEEIQRIRSVYGERSYPETAGPDDILNGEWKELGEDGGIKENGILSSSSFSITVIKDDVIKQVLVNLRKEESTSINIRTAFGNDMELIIHNILKIDHHQADQMNDHFQFLLKNIIHIDKAEIGQALFDKAFKGNSVTSEEQMKEKIKEDLQKEYERYSLADLDRGVQAYLIRETNMQLPVGFIRKLINTTKEEGQADIDDHELEHYVQQAKRDLIQERIARESNINVTEEELKHRAKQDISNYYKQPSDLENDGGPLDQLADSLIKDEKYVHKIRQEVLNYKISDVLKTKITIQEKEVDQHDFFHQ